MNTIKYILALFMFTSTIKVFNHYFMWNKSLVWLSGICELILSFLYVTPLLESMH